MKVYVLKVLIHFRTPKCTFTLKGSVRNWNLFARDPQILWVINHYSICSSKVLPTRVFGNSTDAALSKQLLMNRKLSDRNNSIIYFCCTVIISHIVNAFMTKGWDFIQVIRRGLCFYTQPLANRSSANWNFYQTLTWSYCPGSKVCLCLKLTYTSICSCRAREYDDLNLQANMTSCFFSVTTSPFIFSK
jgi:hypothetical protein